MFCGKCGTEVQEIAKFCPKCGTPIVRTTEAVLSPVARLSESSKKKTGLIVGAALTAIILIVSSIWGITALFSHPEDAETVAVKYVDAAFDLDYKGMNRYMAMPYDKMLADMERVTEATIQYYREEEFSEELIDSLEERKEILSNGTLEKLFGQIGELLSESREESFGRDYKRSVEVLYQTELQDSERSEFLQMLKQNFDNMNFGIEDSDAKIRISNYFSLNKVDAVYEITCEVVEEGSEDIRSTEVEFMLLEIDGEYKAFDGMFGGGDSILNYVDTSEIDVSKMDESLRSLLGEIY